MSLHGDIAMFWRFASLLRFGSAKGLPRGDLDEARDEIASIALHTRSAELKGQCMTLVDAYQEQRARDFTIVPIEVELPLATAGRCPGCGSPPREGGSQNVVRFIAG